MKKTRMIVLMVSMLFTLNAVFGGGLDGEFKDSYYKDWPLFHFYPAADVPRYKVGKLGPVGLGLELRQPAFTMYVDSIDKGSPADKTGAFKKGQLIESINGQVLKDVDPRVILGNLITEAEAKDGVLKFMVKDNQKADAKEVVVTIPVMGAYSDTWPLDCPKSDKIVRNFADFLVKANKTGYGAALFLLSTGEEKDLEVVRKWFSGKLGENGGYPWDIGYKGPAVCEYYLRTGDESVLPAIKSWTEYLKRTIYNGSWMGRGGCNYNYMAGGHMNAAGVHSLTFLLMARQCGVDVDEHTLQSCLYHFYRYAGHWNVSYGDGLPEGGGVDNGKNGGLAFAMAAAATLHPDGEKSVYAKARDISANKSFYTTSWLFHGHTGGGIGEIWRGAAAGLLAKKRPKMYRSFMNERRWMYELARSHDGAFGWSDGPNVGYNTTGDKGGRSWGNLVPLIYTIPRQKLRIYGAPATKHSKTYAIPDRPWGTQADETFYSLEAGEYKPGKKQDLSEERLPTHASWPILRRISRNPEVTDDELLAYAHHPDSIGQGSAAGGIRAAGRNHLILPLLKSKDPRGRYTGIQTLLGGKKDKGEDPELTDEVIQTLGAMISDPNESWWVVMHALRALSKAPSEKVGPYLTSIDKWLKHEDWWLRHAALQAATPLALDTNYYQKVLPVIGEMVRTNTRAVALGPLYGIISKMNDAAPEVQALAAKELAEAYRNFPKEFNAPGGQDMSNCVDYMIKGIARNLANVPGGFDKLYQVSKERYPEQVLPHKDLYMRADTSTFGPVVKDAFKPIVLNQLIPQYIGYTDHTGANSDYLRAEAASEPTKKKYRGPKMDALVALYKRIGVTDYDWRTFGPDLDEIKWMYHSYDPKETKIWEPGFRYRKVSAPEGMKDWNKPAFDAKAAGWKQGQAPFGQFDGKLKTLDGCSQPFCRCGEPMKTLWENEVLMLQTKLKLPAFKENHRYRLVVGGMSHVQGGDGFEIYVNGKLLFKRTSGVGKRQGGQPVCLYLDKSHWPTFGNEVTIAAKGFLPIPGGKRSPGVKKNHFSVWLQEMKCPPITDEMVMKGKLMQPLFCSAWQATKDNADMYYYDGEFVGNNKLPGSWKKVANVAMADEFEPGKGDSDATKFQRGVNRLDLKAITLNNDGSTDTELVIWSGNMLLDLRKRLALAMELRTIDGQEFLFIETGGFHSRNADDWTSPWTVFTRAK